MLIRILAFIWSKLYSYTFSLKIGIIYNKFYTHWLSTELKSIGEKSILNSPIDLGGGRYISIGNNSGICSNTILSAWDTYLEDHFNPEISIGDNVWIGEDAHITAINQIRIGNGVLIGKKVTITDNSHGVTDETILTSPPIKRRLHSKGPVIIDDNVWIGDKVTILPNVRIGRNSIIGANSVVSKDIEANSIAIGIPARVIKVIK